MAVTVPFVKLDQPNHGRMERLSPLVRRVIAANPGPFTYTGTGTYVIGTGEVAVIDPGPLDQAHIDSILAGLGAERISHILITHTHLDHSPAAAPIKAATNALTYGFGPHGRSEDGTVVEAGGDMDFSPDQVIVGGDVVAGTGWTIDVVHTPGHTSNHLCFALREERALFTGDHVMGWSTTIISPPDGNMADYMASLELLLARNDEIYYPTHGAPITAPKDLVNALIAHRLEREDQILACLADGPRTLAQMVPVVYAAVDKRLHPAAARSMLAHLERMVAIGRVSVTGDLYARIG